MAVDFKVELVEARAVGDIFKLVKFATWKFLGESRSGLELGLLDLGDQKDDMWTAFHPVDSNIIIMNKNILEKISYIDHDMYTSYLFHMILYEYLRSMGYHKPSKRKELAIYVTENAFGDDHIATHMARNLKKFFPAFNYIEAMPRIPIKPRIVKDFDRFATSYIH